MAESSIIYAFPGLGKSEFVSKHKDWFDTDSLITQEMRDMSPTDRTAAIKEVYIADFQSKGITPKRLITNIPDWDGITEAFLPDPSKLSEIAILRADLKDQPLEDWLKGAISALKITPQFITKGEYLSEHLVH